MQSDEENPSTEAPNDGDSTDEDDAPAVEYSEVGSEPADERAAESDEGFTEDGEDAEDAEGAEDETESEAESNSVTDVESILVDPDDVVRSIAYNGQEDIGRKGKAVFSLSPPFGETVEPTIRHLDEDSTETKADEEIHIRPFRFVAEGRRVVDQRPTRSLAKSELEDEDPSEAAIEAWTDEAMETWTAHVRENLVGSVDIYSSQGMAFVDVEYRGEGEGDASEEKGDEAGEREEDEA